MTTALICPQDSGERLPLFFVDARGCWIWTRRLSYNSYAIFNEAPLAGKRAARQMWEDFNDPIPAGLEIDHLCRQRLCVNPAHLEPVTRWENLLRGDSPSAVNYRKTHCKHGHEFTQENTSLYESKRVDLLRRDCKTCARIRRANRYAVKST